MNYAKDYKNDNHSISVNTLIKPQRKPNLSVVSHDDTIEQREPVQAGETSLPVAPRQDIASNNPAVSNTGLAEAQTAPAVVLPAQSSETAAAPGEQITSGADNTAESAEAGPAQAVQTESAPDTPAQGIDTGAAEPVETGNASLLEGESLPQAEDIPLEAEEESKSNKEPDRPKHKIMAAAASEADSNAGSRTPEAVQLAGNNTGSGLGENSPGLSQSGDALNSVRNGGEPLPEGLRRNMENAMATDFKNVHLHRDGPSAAMAGEMGAKAFTHREDIYFNQGQYNPDTTGGRRLIAHELAHVEQQRTILGLQYQLEVPGERDRYEQEADAVADKVVNSPAPVQSAGGQSAPAVTKSSSGSIQLAKEESGSSWFSEKIGVMLKNIPGYDMLILVIGRDPVSGREVKRDGFAFIKAIVGLIPGGKLLLENLEKAGIISRAVAWFKDEFQALNISFNSIKSLFDQALKSIGWNLIKSFEKIKNIFMAPIQRIGNFLHKAGPKLMEFIFEGALALAGAPVKAIMGILNKGKEVLSKIIKDPIGFLKNLLSAVKGGLGNFVGNIVTHLQNGIGGWIFGALGKAGIILPEKLNLAGIFHIAAQVLGVTWRAIKTLVVKRLGAMGEKIMGQVEKSIDFVVSLITKGPMALLEMAKDFLAELKNLFFDTLIDWVRNTIVVKAIQKLISMFNPVGAIIQAVITIYNTIQFFIERAKQIAAFVGAVFNSIVEIAGGNIGKAIAAVENALAKGVPVAISFLANLLGLGGIAKKVQEIIKKIRKPIDKVVGKVVGFVVGKAKQIWGKIQGIGKKKGEPPKNQEEHDAQVKAGLEALEGEQRKVDKDRDNALTFEEAEDVAKNVKRQYPVFKSITVVDGGDTWDYDYVASPGEKKKGLKKQLDDPIELEKDIITRLTTHENAYLVKLGPKANEEKGYILATSDGYTKDELRKIQELGKIYGCHYTGDTTLNYYVPDHQAPSKLLTLAKENIYIYKLLKEYNVRVDQAQKLYPQSRKLSEKQGGVVSTLTQKLKKLIELRRD